MTARLRFGQWVNEQLQAGLTRTNVAQRLGCHPSMVTRIIDGSRAHPKLSIVHAIETATADWAGGQIRTEEWLPAAKSSAGEAA